MARRVAHDAAMRSASLPWSLAPRALALALSTALSAALAVTVAAPAAFADEAASPSGGAVVDTVSAESRIVRTLERRVADRRLGPATSYVVLDTADNRVVAARAADRRMLPASNMKIVTAVTALAALGPDAQLTTRIVSAGPNDLVIVGGGDPMLRKSEVRAMARALAPTLDPALPVSVRVDDSLFGDPGDGPGWPSSYTPGIASNVRALGMLGEYASDTARNVAQAFANELGRAGITATVGGRVAADPAWPVVASVSHPVSEAVRLMLLVSENNVAEVLFRQVALASGQPATWAGGEAAARAQLAALGIDVTGLALKDGSGLSRTNRLTALSLANIVRLSRSGDPRFAAMYDPAAMPTSGASGTLDDRYGRFTTKRSRCAAGAVRAKTGTLFDTIALSGITTGADGREKAFSVLVNERPRRFSQLATRQAVDALAAAVRGCR